MMTKIEWYKEVLAIEPNSKVFFPLAKLLIETGDIADAQQVLAQGIDRHPEYFEAKFLLVDVLQQLGRAEESRRQVWELTTKMSGYAAFWKEWGCMLSGQEKGRDLALAVQFLAASFQGAPISWAEVIEHGLIALGHGAPSAARPKPAPDLKSEAPATPAQAPASARSSQEEQLPVVEQAQPEVVAVLAPTPAGGPAVAEISARVLAAEPADEDESDEEEETFSLRTRTMAELLAEQGDHVGALDIYRELHAATPPGQESDDLARRIDKMIARMQEKPGKVDANGARRGGSAASGTSGVADAHDAAGAHEAGGLRSKKKLMSALEKLAQRLEARASG